MLSKSYRDDFKSYHRYLLRESLFGFIYRRLILYPVLRLIVGPVFLDVGCGLGIFLRYGDRKYSLGLDVNALNVRYIIRRGRQARVIPQSGLFPVESSSFQSCVLDQVIEHLCSPEVLVSEIYRCLKVGGLLLVGVTCQKGFQSDPDHKVYYGSKDLVLAISSIAPFSHVCSFYFPFPGERLGRVFAFQYHYSIFKKS